MISIFKKFKNISKNRGMTYAELIVVLSIFAIMSTVVLANYGSFQKKIEVKNLANDIALKILQAQRDSVAGVNGLTFFGTTASGSAIKPSYGVYFNTSTDAMKQQIIYSSDISNNGYLTSSSASPIPITQGNRINELKVFACGQTYTPTGLSILFKRPDSNAIISPENTSMPNCSGYADITVTSLDPSIFATIRVYSSGRIVVQ